MKILFLGTAGYHPNEQRQTTSIFLPELGLALDAGTGFFRIREFLETNTLDILLSHAHLDHTIGLTFLYGITHQKEVAQIRTYAPAQKLDAIQQHLFHPDLFPLPPNFECVPLADSGVNQLCHAQVSSVSIPHPGGAVAYRIESDLEPKTLAYVTDTTATSSAAYVDLIRNVDVLIHECNFRDGQEDLAELTGHSSLTPVLQLARAANVGQLVLTHINCYETSVDPLGHETIDQMFPNTIVATDGLEILV